MMVLLCKIYRKNNWEKVVAEVLAVTILVSAAVSLAISYPLQKKVEALESMVEMLSKAVRGKYDEGK